MSRCQILIPTRYNNEICFVGDFPTKEEALFGFPFEGGYGRLLTEMCLIAKIIPRECAMTNVFQDPMPGGRINAICTKKKEATERAKLLGWESYHLPAVGQAIYIDAYRSLELLRLRNELLEYRPNLVVALGPTALWALCGTAKIGKYRGTVIESTLVPGLKVLPTYHPRTILGEYSKKPVAVADLMKARREKDFPEIEKVERWIYIAECAEDIFRFHKNYLTKAELVSIDIETLNSEFISFIGFSADPKYALVIPFIKSISGKRGTFSAYWPTLEEEIEIWEIVAELIDSCSCILGQNFLYDIQFFIKHLIWPFTYSEDTMLLQHARYIELEKSLAFLGSIHTNEVAWKEDRKRGQAKVSELKADD